MWYFKIKFTKMKQFFLVIAAIFVIFILLSLNQQNHQVKQKDFSTILVGTSSILVEYSESSFVALLRQIREYISCLEIFFPEGNDTFKRCDATSGFT